jgi:uncharacterized phage protein (TIGR01671 family)
MRAIKFRGKRMNDNKWVYGYFGKDYSERCIISNYLNASNEAWGVIPETIGQFTGLLDKNGKEIYEGDILQNTPREVQYKVYWSKDMHAWFVERINYGSKEPLCCLDDKFEVIGSIYDNPELIN